MPAKNQRSAETKQLMMGLVRHLHANPLPVSVTQLAADYGKVSYFRVRSVVAAYPEVFIRDDHGDIILSGELPFAFEIEEAPTVAETTKPVAVEAKPAKAPAKQKAEFSLKALNNKWARKYFNLEAFGPIMGQFAKGDMQITPEYWELYNTLRTYIAFMEIARAKDPAKKAAELIDKPEAIEAIQMHIANRQGESS